jgi:hypothetical protein
MKKSTLIAVAAFGVLLVTWFATREKQVAVGVQRLELPALAADQVVSVTVSGPFSVALRKVGAAWTVADPAKAEQSYPADDGQVQALLTALGALKAPDFVTERSEKHAEYELDEAKGLNVTVATAAGPAVELVLGKASKSGGAYVRRAKATAVFTTSSPAAFQLKKAVSGWRKKAITTAPLAEVMKVSVTHPDGSVVQMVRGEGTAWLLDGPTPAGFRFDGAAAGRVVSQLTGLSAQDFAEGDTDDFKAPVVLRAELKDGKATVVSLGAKRPEGTVPLRVEGDAQTYLLASWQAEGLTKRLDDLRDTSLLSFDPQKVTKLVLAAAGKKTVVVKDAAAWKLVEPLKPPDGFEFDSQEVESQLGRLRSLRGLRLETGASEAKAGFSAGGTMVELTVEGEKALKLRFGGPASNANEVYVKGAADEGIYVIGQAEKLAFEKGVELFKRRPPPDLSQMRGLEQLPPEVRRQLEAQLRQRGQ